MKYLVYAFVIFMLCISLTAKAEKYIQDESCSLFDAVYVSQAKHKNAKLKYQIRFEKNLNYTPYVTPKLFVYLDTFLNIENKKISTLKMEYRCSGGSVGKCWLSFDDYKKNHLFLVGLKPNFSLQTIGHAITEAPAALVIPNTAATFNYVNWEDVQHIQYFTKSKTSPDFSVPVVWEKTCKVE